MIDRTAMLAAICANPADDTPRLVFADWLDEHGEPERAEFIRVQCELARLPVGCSRSNECNQLGHGPCQRCRQRDAIRRRERALLDLGIAVLCPEIAESPAKYFPFVAEEDVAWSRGFISAVTSTAADWLAHADAIYWRPSQTEKCWHPLGGTLRNECAKCDGSGRVPRPCPPTAQPVTKVRLTTRGINLVDVLERAYRNGFRPPPDVDDGMGGTMPAGTPIAELLGWAWPGVEFELLEPQYDVARSIERAQRLIQSPSMARSFLQQMTEIAQWCYDVLDGRWPSTDRGTVQ